MLNRPSNAAPRRGRAGDRAPHGWRGLVLALAATLAAAGAALIAATALFPAAQVWPATAMSLLLAATATALIAWIAPPEAGVSRIVFWDTAGGLAAIGLVCAALLGEPEPAVALIEPRR
jgi:hypothetical protein